tara:strand:+ start:644 stop:838 length:195 start_codon:yes stop_codon:yes gene_type:complete
MTSEQKKIWDTFRKSDNPELTNEEYGMIAKLHADVFNHELWKPCTCDDDTFQKMISDLNNKFLE